MMANRKFEYEILIEIIKENPPLEKYNWSLQLLANELMKKRCVESISRQAISKILNNLGIKIIKKIRICEVEGCKKKSITKKYCSLHYARFKAHGDVFKTNREIKECKVDECDRNARHIGYCARHYKQIERYGRLTPELEKKTTRKLCNLCKRDHYAKGLCRSHYGKSKYRTRKKV